MHAVKNDTQVYYWTFGQKSRKMSQPERGLLNVCNYIGTVPYLLTVPYSAKLFHLHKAPYKIIRRIIAHGALLVNGILLM